MLVASAAVHIAVLLSKPISNSDDRDFVVSALDLSPSVVIQQ